MPAANTFQWISIPVFGSPGLPLGSPGVIPVTGGNVISTFGQRAVCGISSLGSTSMAYYNQPRTAGDGGKFYVESTCLHIQKHDVGCIILDGSPVDILSRLTGAPGSKPGSFGIDQDGESTRDGSTIPLTDNYDGSFWDPGEVTTDGRFPFTNSESGDTYMFAIDFDTNRFYKGVNGIWFRNEDPSGSTGSPQGGTAISDLGSPLLQTYFLAGSHGGGTNLLNAGGVEFDYTIPTGYFPWGIGSPLPSGVGGSPVGSPSGPVRVGFTGITVNLNDIATDITVVRTSGTQTIDGVKIFTDQLRGDVSGTSAAVPAFGFRDIDQVFLAGIYRSGANELSFSTDGIQRFRIESTGVLRALDSSYESNVTNDDVIPNKKYVDGLASTGGLPTENTFVGTSSISGLNPNETYLVHGYGIIPHKRVGYSFDCILDAVILRRGTTTPGAGTIVAATPSQFMGNSAFGIPGPLDAWDGEFQSEASFICEMNGDTEINMEFNTTCSGPLGTDCFPGAPRNGTAYYQRYSIHMTAVQISSGVGSPIVGSPSFVGVIELDNMPATITGNAAPFGPFRALASLQINSNGNGETAVGSTASVLVYSSFGNDWLVSGGPASDFEVRVDQVSLTGGGTIFGTLGVFQPLTSTRTFTLRKTTDGLGIAIWTINVEIRQISDPSNTTGANQIILQADQT